MHDRIRPRSQQEAANIRQACQIRVRPRQGKRVVCASNHLDQSMPKQAEPKQIGRKQIKS